MNYDVMIVILQMLAAAIAMIIGIRYNMKVNHDPDWYDNFIRELDKQDKELNKHDDPFKKDR